MTFDVEKSEKSREGKLYRNVRCDGCDEPLTMHRTSDEFPEGVWDSLQYAEKAILIELDGSYFMAIDPCHEEDYADLTKIFCVKCLEKLCGQWPCFAKVIEDGCSSGVGHHCTKERKFIWSNNAHCCHDHCASCGILVSNDKILLDEKDIYSRKSTTCKCGVTAPCKWDWEFSTEERCAKHDGRPIGQGYRGGPGCYVCECDAYRACICKGSRQCPDCPDPQADTPVLCKPDCTGYCLLCEPNIVAVLAELAALKADADAMWPDVWKDMDAKTLAARRFTDVDFVRGEIAEQVRALFASGADDLESKVLEAILKEPASSC